MASPSERTRNNVQAGILVTVTILCAFVVIAVLEDFLGAFEPRTNYVIRFPVEMGIEGLAVGSDVKIGGVLSGTVGAILLSGSSAGPAEARGGPVTHIDVEVQLDRVVTLYPNASVIKELPLLGSAGWINFESVGDSTAGPALVAGDTVEASTGAGMLGRMIAPGQLARIDQILDNLDAIIAAARSDYAAHVGPSTRHLEQALADAAQLVAAARHDYGDWRRQIGDALEGAVAASSKIDQAVDEGIELVRDARGGVAAVRSAIDDNRPALDAIVENVEGASQDVREIATRVNDELLDRVDALLASGQAGLETFTSLGERLAAEVDLAGPRLQSAMADAQLMAQQLKLASIEIRRSPWRLLYRPSNQELEHELLYEAARSFALAAGDLQGTASSMERVLDRHGDLLAADPALVERVRLMLDQSFRRYEQAQQILFTILLQQDR